MLFNSYEFIFLFLPVTLLAFALLGKCKGQAAALLWLVIASLFFYAWWNPKYLALIGFSIVFNFSVGRLLTSFVAESRNVRATFILVAGVCVNLALIAYFKYANFFVDSVAHLTNTDWQIEKIVLPIAISFFTFQQITYLVDARRGITEEHNFIQYCLFVTFFPQLIAGPIVHHKEMLPQFLKARNVSLRVRNISLGITIFAVGLFKKVIIADQLALTATPVFDVAETGATLHFFQAWSGTICYSLQLYFDFSGYSDMAIGLARLFGIRLPLNFNSPYQATNIIDFWRRWHMTLSRFLRDYVYIPLGGSRRGSARRYANILITMLLGGLWHGAGWTFVAWGFLHGLAVVLNHAWRAVWRAPIERWWSIVLARSVTLLFVTLAWVPFRAQSFDGAIRVYEGMVNLPETLSARLGPLTDVLTATGIRFAGPWIDDADVRSVFWLGLWVLALWIFPNTQQWLRGYEPACNYPDSRGKNDEPWILSRFPALYWRPTVWWGIYAAALLATALLGLTRVTEFLYFQF